MAGSERNAMILVTRLNGVPFAVNADLIERVEGGADTVLTMVDGHKYVVAEPVEEIINRIAAFRASILVVADHIQHEPARPASRRLRLVTDQTDKILER